MIASILQNLKNDYNDTMQLGLAAEKWFRYPPVAFNHVANNPLTTDCTK